MARYRDATARRAQRPCRAARPDQETRRTTEPGRRSLPAGRGSRTWPDSGSAAREAWCARVPMRRRVVRRHARLQIPDDLVVFLRSKTQTRATEVAFREGFHEKCVGRQLGTKNVHERLGAVRLELDQRIDGTPGRLVHEELHVDHLLPKAPSHRGVLGIGERTQIVHHRLAICVELGHRGHDVDVERLQIREPAVVDGRVVFLAAEFTVRPRLLAVRLRLMHGALGEVGDEANTADGGDLAGERIHRADPHAARLIEPAQDRRRRREQCAGDRQIGTDELEVGHRQVHRYDDHDDQQNDERDQLQVGEMARRAEPRECQCGSGILQASPEEIPAGHLDRIHRSRLPSSRATSAARANERPDLADPHQQR